MSCACSTLNLFYEKLLLMIITHGHEDMCIEPSSRVIMDCY